MSLRLVDAELDFLVAGSPNTRYVALSYVLGQRQNIENDLGIPGNSLADEIDAAEDTDLPILKTIKTLCAGIIFRRENISRSIVSASFLSER